jgi:hypothetical protein
LLEEDEEEEDVVACIQWYDSVRQIIAIMVWNSNGYGDTVVVEKEEEDEEEEVAVC